MPLFLNILAQQRKFFIFSFLCVAITFLCTLAAHAAENPVYRFYSPIYQSHFFTGSEEEKSGIIANDSNNWCYEGIAYFTPDLPTNQKPVFRFYSHGYKSHFFTTSETEKDSIIANDDNWVYEGIAYNVTEQSASTNPVYRFYSSTYKSHFYTVSAAEKDGIVANDKNWTYEGIAYHVSQKAAEGSNLECIIQKLPIGDLGPDISVGIHSYSKDDIRSDPIVIKATNASYIVKDSDGETIGTLSSGTETEIRYDGDGNLEISGGIDEQLVDGQVFFQAANSANEKTIIFDVNNPNSAYDTYRHSMRVRYDDASKKIWSINTLPLEQYVWGIGEITATGPEEYNRAMTVAFRTYGTWKIKYSTSYALEDFDVDATPGNQIYRGYEWEDSHPRIREAAEITQGRIVTYDDDVVLLPFSSWTDGDTRNYLDGHWNSNCVTDPSEDVSDFFPYLIGVNDEWGEHPSSGTCTLAAAGNHMVGISANGALNLAGDEGWAWDRILSHYLTDISLTTSY